MTTTQPTVTPEALAFCNRAQAMFIQLVARWRDEREYENIADYAKPLEPMAKETGVTILRMTGRPFACHFAVNGREFVLSLVRNRYGYKRVK